MRVCIARLKHFERNQRARAERLIVCFFTYRPKCYELKNLLGNDSAKWTCVRLPKK